MSVEFLARNKVAIVGYAQSQVVRRGTETVGATALKTARRAIADAGLTVDQIDGFVAAQSLPSAGGHVLEDGVSYVSANWLSENIGAQPGYVVGFTGLGQLSGSMSMAINAIASGAAKYVVLHRALYNPPGKYNDNPMTEAQGRYQWSAPFGFHASIAPMAMIANEYFQRYGGGREVLARISVEARKNGARLPWSYWYGKPLSLEDYMAEPLLNDPMCRFDCDIPVQGVGAIVLTSAERAKDMPHKPVYISSYASGYPRERRIALHWTLDEMQEAGEELATRLWAGAGFGPGDIDLAQPYDAFTPFVLIWLEALGLCPRGEAHRRIMEGWIDSDDPHSIAAISGGGAIGNGRLHGVPQLIECYLQVAGRAGERQRDVTTAVSSYSAPHFGGGAIVYTNAP
jgi:acetyl-CoA acetyltransferase